jgi:hypothetical protein
MFSTTTKFRTTAKKTTATFPPQRLSISANGMLDLGISNAQLFAEVSSHVCLQVVKHWNAG